MRNCREIPAILPAHSPRQPHRRYGAFHTDVDVHKGSTRSPSHGLQQASCNIPLQHRSPMTLSCIATTPGWAHRQEHISPDRHSYTHVHNCTYINVAIIINVDNTQKSASIHPYTYSCTHRLGHTATAVHTYGHSAKHAYPNTAAIMDTTKLHS